MSLLGMVMKRISYLHEFMCILQTHTHKLGSFDGM